MAETVQSYKVECPGCDMIRESDDFDEVATFADKHAEHTNHEVTWVQADFDIDDELLEEWTLRCDTCDELWRFESKRRAREHRQEHAEYTDHQIPNPPTEETIEFPEDAGAPNIRSLIESMEDNFEHGVPEQAVYAYFAGDESRLSTVRASVAKLRHRGEVYEPTQGKLRTT